MNAATRQAVEIAIRDHPSWSNAEIASALGLKANAVSNVRHPRGASLGASSRPQRRLPDPVAPLRPDEKITLDSALAADEPPDAPGGGVPDGGLPDEPVRPTLDAKTRNFLEQVLAPLSQAAVGMAVMILPETAQVFVPSPPTAALLLAPPLRIVARHSHLKMDELSEDGRDMISFVGALGAWGAEIYGNLKGRVEAAPSAASGRPVDRAGGSNGSNGARRTDSAAPAPADVASGGNGAGGYALGAVGGPGYVRNGLAVPAARNGAGPDGAPPDPATAAALISGLRAADAEGRRRLGIN